MFYASLAGYGGKSQKKLDYLIIRQLQKGIKINSKNDVFEDAEQSGRPMKLTKRDLPQIKRYLTNDETLSLEK